MELRNIPVITANLAREMGWCSRIRLNRIERLISRMVEGLAVEAMARPERTFRFFSRVELEIELPDPDCI